MIAVTEIMVWPFFGAFMNSMENDRRVLSMWTTGPVSFLHVQDRLMEWTVVYA
jgi:hypothetical protein